MRWRKSGKDWARGNRSRQSGTRRAVARRLTRAFFERGPSELAPALLNKLLVSTRDDVKLVARIVEVEAYRGSTDPASHAFRGMTARNATMFGPPGRLYVYFTYGMHFCVNVVAGAPAGDAGAVLLRAAVPIAGLDVMRTRRPAARQEGRTGICRHTRSARATSSMMRPRSTESMDIASVLRRWTKFILPDLVLFSYRRQ